MRCVFIILFSALLLFGCAGLSGKTEAQKAAEQNTYGEVREGKVNLDEIGGSGFVAVSSLCRNCSVSPDGRFSIAVSSNEPQIIALLDSKSELRATAVAVPNDPDALVFDSESTAKALLWKGTGKNGKEILWEISQRKCYQPLYGYLKANLKQRSLNSISMDPEYLRMISDCIKEPANSSG